MAGEKKRCEAAVWMKDMNFPRQRRCAHEAKYEEDGKGWCGTHLPSRVKVKQEAATAKWNAEWAAKERARRLKKDHEKKLTAAREAVIQAAKAWADGEWRDMDTQADLGAAVDALNALETDNDTD